MRRELALVAFVVGALAGCGQQTGPGSPEPLPTATPSPTITLTAAPFPEHTGPPPGPQGIPQLHQMSGDAYRYGAALTEFLDRTNPGHTHSIACTAVPMLVMTGASTRCDVSTDGSTVLERWTALTVTGTTQVHGDVIEFSQGVRTDIPPFPPRGPASP